MRRFASPVRCSSFAFVTLLLTACGHDLTQPNAGQPRDKPLATLAAGPNDLSDGQGVAWRQITETVGLTWTQVAAVCPRDGASPCTGNVGATSLAGWVWATDEQVVQLIARYEPAILTNRVLNGPAYDAGIARFFGAFQPSTIGGCSGSGYQVSCSFGSHVSGWTSTSTSAGTAISAVVQSGFFAPSFINVGTDASINSSLITRGLFLWRADGSGGTGITARDDYGQIDSPNAGVVVANVLSNDSLSGTTATIDRVTITALSSSSPKLTLNVADGSVSVTAGLRVGAQSLRYRICETARPSNCETATVFVTVNGNVIDAVDDNGATKTGGGLAVANVLDNDRLAGSVATLARVTLNAITTTAALTISASGAVALADGATIGAHSLTYEICEVGNAYNCDQATVRVMVSNYAIDAVNDQGTAPASRGGVAVSNVLANDTFAGIGATLNKVSLTPVSATGSGLTLNVADGSVRVAAGSPGGTQSLTYRICEIAYPANCDTATVTVTVAPQVYVISKDRMRVNEGSSDSFTVSLGQQPNDNVTVSVAYLAGTMSVTATPASLTFTAANWNMAQTVSFKTTKDSDKTDNAGTLKLSSPDIANGYVVINGTDTDRRSSLPAVTIQSPYNGETVSGQVNFWGSATVSAGATLDAKFSVESNRIATVSNGQGSFRPPLWNSTTVTNGWQTLEMRVTDTLGNETRSSIMVFVNN